MATLNTNVTTAGGLSSTLQTYYDKRMLQYAKPKLPFYQYGQKRPVTNGKTIQFRKWTKFGTLTTALTEGVVPDGQTLAMTNITATAAQYGGYVAVSDFLDMTALDPVISDSVKLMGQQGGETVNEIIANEIFAGTNVQYAGGKTSRETITASDVLSMDEIKKAVRTLKKADAPKHSRNGKGYYICFVNPDAAYSLMSDAEWIDVSKYAAAEQIFDGELGKAYGVVFVESTTVPLVNGGASDALDVTQTLLIGDEAFGVSELGKGTSADPSRIHTIVKPRGSAGTADPLDQISTIGWKVDGFVCKRLQEAWMVRIESAVKA